LLDNDELRIFEGEDLLIFRDWSKENNNEEIQFTYDLLGGYFVSKWLIKEYGNSYPIIKIEANYFLVGAIKTALEFVIPERGTKLLGKIIARANTEAGSNKSLIRFAKSREFQRKLLKKKTEHPLFDDILRTICILLIKTKKIFLFELLKNERAKRYSTESLFEINSNFIEDNKASIKSFLKIEFFNKNNMITLLNLAKNIELDSKHPLNFKFWSSLLNELSMEGRDVSWSEYVRKNNSKYSEYNFFDFISYFEKVCKRNENLSDRVHIAAIKVMWVLTTTVRKLRDETTRALYYYARRYPEYFLDLLRYSLSINDPYVLERMLAASYGLAMARQNDFEDDSYNKEWLPKYGIFLFENIFSKNTSYATTQILSRDYRSTTLPKFINNK
jgi:hypothetical protein